MDALISSRRRALLQALGATTLLAACGDRRSAGLAPAYEFRGPTMGSAYTLKLAGATLDTAGVEAARDAVHDALAAVERAMSAYQPDSELSRFNRHSGGRPFALSADTFAVFELAQRVGADTGGAFDITVAPVVDAWGFGPARNRRVVAALEVALLSRNVGLHMLALDRESRSAVKAHDGVRADLSGIAKGFGVDKAAHALDACGIDRYMIEAGGEVRTRGTNTEGRPWQIAIEEPDAMPQRPHFVVPLQNLAMATSGDYRIYFEQDGRRYCHEIDPATGRPIENGVASVTVVSAECAYADAMATALMVMGAESGFALAEERRIAAYFLVRGAGNALRARATSAFLELGGYRVI
jgi:thiamine biosynthesis lipoprotein